jgi:spermidine/putrescine transport system substrate-binding protein
MMARPVSRRTFLQGTLGLSLGAGGAALVAGCRGDTPPAAGAAAPQIASPENPVLWPVSADNRPIPPGRQPERNATLHLYNWEDYINAEVIKAFERKYRAYNVKVKVSTFDNASAAVSNVRSGKADYDILFVTYDLLGQLVLGNHLRPLSHRYIPNINQVWPVFQNPFYDQDWRYSVPYTVYTTGIGWRTDKVKEDIAKLADPYEILWNSSYQGRVGVLDEYRETIGMVLLKNGISNLNTTRPKHLDLVRQDLLDLASATRPVIDVNAYEDLPTGKTWVSMAFSGDLVAAPEYLPEGLDPAVLRYWFPLDGRGTVGNDLMTILGSSRNPVLAHHFLNFLLDFDMAMLNLEWNGFQPPLVRIDPSVLVKQGYIPPNLTTAVVRQEYFETGFRAVELDPEVDKSWREVWSQFKATL